MYCSERKLIKEWNSLIKRLKAQSVDKDAIDLLTHLIPTKINIAQSKNVVMYFMTQKIL